jgi:hypothetical protein
MSSSSSPKLEIILSHQTPRPGKTVLYISLSYLQSVCDYFHDIQVAGRYTIFNEDNDEEQMGTCLFFTIVRSNSPDDATITVPVKQEKKWSSAVFQWVAKAAAHYRHRNIADFYLRGQVVPGQLRIDTSSMNRRDAKKFVRFLDSYEDKRALRHFVADYMTTSGIGIQCNSEDCAVDCQFSLPQQLGITCQDSHAVVLCAVRTAMETNRDAYEEHVTRCESKQAALKEEVVMLKVVVEELKRELAQQHNRLKKNQNQ